MASNCLKANDFFMFLMGGPVGKHSITDPQVVAEQWSRRFKVVKIPFTEPFKRGRWTCQDFFDPPETKQEDKPVQVNTSPGEGDVPSSDTGDGQAKDGTGPAVVPGSGVTPEEPSQTSQASHNVGGTVLMPAPTQTPAPTPQGQEPSTTDGNYSACGAGGIDNKIEQAMDLVKSHLMFAVREEVDVLREKITELNERNEQLQQENSLLRSLLTPELAQRFAALQQQHKTAAPPRPAQVPPSSLPAQSIPRTAPSLAAFGVPGRPSVSPVASSVGGNFVPSKPANPAVSAAGSSPSSQQPTTSLPASLANVAANATMTTPTTTAAAATTTTPASHQQPTTGAAPPAKEVTPPAGGGPAKQ